MYKERPDNDLSFADQFFGEKDPVPDDHIYVRMARAVDWDTLLDKLDDFYRETGRPSTPVRPLIMLLLVKHLQGFSDRELVECLKMNLALQKACDLTFREAQRFVEPSTLSRFRERIGEVGARMIVEAAAGVIQKQQTSKTVVVDTTVVPSDVAYPTDLRLLESARRFLVRFIERFRDKRVRTQSRKARRTYLRHVKLGQQTARRQKRRQGEKDAASDEQGKMFLETHQRMLEFVRRNLHQARKVAARLDVALERALSRMATIERFLGQQEEVLAYMKRYGRKHGIHIKDRIVSLCRDYVRPMVRGKIPVSTEFGAKLLLELRDGFLTVLKITFENVADEQMIREFFPRWRGMILGADRGFHSPGNAVLATEAGIAHYLVEKKGRIGLTKNARVRRVRGIRASLEGYIGVSKRKYGLGRNRYKRGPDGEMQWIYLGITAMNLRSAVA